MSTNPLNDISRVYLEQVVTSQLDESSHLETDMKKRQDANEKAIDDMKKTKAHKDMVSTVRKKFDEALDPVGKEDDDVDNDGKKNTNADKYLLNRRKAVGKAISTKEEKEVKKWWDDDGDGKGYEKGEVSGKFKKKKVTKENFSNWREDLIEILNTDEKDKKIVEKKVSNKIKINPNLPESVEELGGTLIEMIEIDEIDYIVESVYDELLKDGYDEDSIEEAIEYALVEAKVTFGHDTHTAKSKSTGVRQTVKAVSRLARKKLSSKVREVKKSAKQAVASGAKKVAKGALSVARKMESGESKPSAAHTKTRKASTYRGAGVGTKEKVSSGSYKAPSTTKKKVEKPSDPWEGSATTPPKVKTKVKTKKTPAPKTKTPTTVKRNRKSKLDDLLSSIRKEEIQIDEKTLTKKEMKKREEIAKSMNLSDFEKRYPGRGMEVKMATATKIAKKMAEQNLDELAPLAAAGIAAGAAGLTALAVRNARKAAASGVNAANSGAKPTPKPGIAGAAYNIQKRNQEMKKIMDQM